MAKRRVSPKKGKKIDKEARGKNAPKLGRRFLFNEGSETKVVALTLPKGMFEFLSKKYKTDCVSAYVREGLIEASEL